MGAAGSAAPEGAAGGGGDCAGGGSAAAGAAGAAAAEAPPEALGAAASGADLQAHASISRARQSWLDAVCLGRFIRPLDIILLEVPSHDSLAAIFAGFV